MKKEKLEEIKLEQDFPAENMTANERDFYINLLLNCKDIKSPVNIKALRSQIVELHLNKKGKEIYFNGSVHYELINACENRCISGMIFKHKGNFYVDMLVTRLVSDCPRKTYSTCDEFIVDDNKIVSCVGYYNHEISKKYSEEININIGGKKQ